MKIKKINLFIHLLFHIEMRKCDFTCNGIIRQSIMAVVNVFIRVSTALCRKHTRVSAVPISLDAPAMNKRN